MSMQFKFMIIIINSLIHIIIVNPSFISYIVIDFILFINPKLILNQLNLIIIYQLITNYLLFLINIYSLYLSFGFIIVLKIKFTNSL